MSFPPSLDTSIYELALSSEQPLTPLQISPATLKSMLGSLVGLLIEQRLPSTIWVKLPRGETWQTELQAYCNLDGVGSTLYPFYNYREEDEPVSVELSSPPPLVNGSASVNPIAPTNPNSLARVIPIQLPPESKLRREYFLLVMSPQLNVLVVAHRPRSVQPTRTETNGNSRSHKSTGLEEETGDRKYPLLSLYAFAPATLQRVLDVLAQTLAPGQAKLMSELLSEQVLTEWETHRRACATEQSDPRLLAQLLTKQVHQQEDIWHRTATYRKQAELAESLQAQNETLSQAIRDKDEFLNNVGQELRTPLTNMKTALTLLNSAQLKPQQRQRYMQMISRECDRQSSMITSLIDLVQLDRDGDHAQLQPVHLNDIVPGVVSTYQPLAQEQGVMLAYTIPENLPPVMCLSGWLKQLVINLLHNSIKFTPQGGQVWVRAKQQGQSLQLEFRDTGIGIPASEIPKIFERFYRVRQTPGDDRTGAGLGLTIVQRILQRCQGSISVKSKPGEGSAFYVLLPVYQTAPESQSSSSLSS